MNNFVHQYFIRPFSDFLYPPVCLTCEQLLVGSESRICTPCWKSFARIDSSHPTWCEILGKFRTEGAVEDVLSCFLFEKEGKLQEVIHHLKYGGMKSLGIRLGGELGERFCLETKFNTADILIPVPLHKLKQRERGYNQSEYLCRGISQACGIPVAATLLARTKYTQSQTQLSLRERQANMREAFLLHPAAASGIRGKSCVLVDDVITTGSTINACARELLAAGAARVYGASIALAA